MLTNFALDLQQWPRRFMIFVDHPQIPEPPLLRLIWNSIFQQWQNDIKIKLVLRCVKL